MSLKSVSYSSFHWDQARIWEVIWTQESHIECSASVPKIRFDAIYICLSWYKVRWGTQHNFSFLNVHVISQYLRTLRFGFLPLGFLCIERTPFFLIIRSIFSFTKEKTLHCIFEFPLAHSSYQQFTCICADILKTTWVNYKGSTVSLFATLLFKEFYFYFLLF